MTANTATIGAVLTADVVNSTKLSATQDKRLLEKLENILKPHGHEFYRGDSFQTFLTAPEALRLALACRAAAIELTTKDDAEVRGDIRISIGIGELSLPITSLGSAKGEAFVLSGRELDDLQKGDRRLTIVCCNAIANVGFQVMSEYLDDIFHTMTGKQADIIAELLSGVTQQQLTISREKAKSTISELANAGRWPAIESILQQYEKLVKLIL